MNNVSVMSVSLPKTDPSPKISAKMAPPLFSLDTSSNSQLEIIRLEITFAPIAPAVLLANSFLNLEFLIVKFPSLIKKIAAAYFEVVFKKLEFTIFACELPPK